MMIDISDDDRPLISVIVPIYNAEKYLGKCLDSIIDQSYTNLQIILVNDGSTDGSLEICREYSRLDLRIIVISQKNCGVASARNAGLDRANGVFIGFVDSDDYIDKEMYETLLKAALTNYADIAECGCILVNQDGAEVSSTSLCDQIIEGNFNCAVHYLNHINTKNYVVNKLFIAHIFSDLRFPAYHYSEDYYVNAIASLNCNRRVTIQDKLYFYSQNETSAIHQRFQKKRLDTISAGEIVYKNLESRNKTYYFLLPPAAGYICENCINLYYQIFDEKLEMEEALMHKITEIYRKYYRMALRCDRNRTKLKFLFRLFYFCPQVCIFVRRTYLKLGGL